MPNPLLVVAGATLGSSLIKAKGAKDAAKAQVAATEKAAALQKNVYDEQMGYQQPYLQAGANSTNEMQRLLGLSGDANSAGYGSMAHDFGAQDFQADPGYQFRLSEGLKGLDRQAAARGGLISGSALKAAQGYGQEQASQEYQNAFNRYQTSRQNRLAPLMGLAGIGQTATGQSAQLGGNYANTTGDYYLGAGNARASGYIGAANAYSSGLNSMTKLYGDAAGVATNAAKAGG